MSVRICGRAVVRDRIDFGASGLMMAIRTAKTGLFRDRDFFVHDGSKLRRVRLSAPVQAVLFLILMMLVAWSGYAAARLATGSSVSGDLRSIAAAT